MTIPNIITLFRFLLVPCVVLALLYGEMGWAFFCFLVAGVSDGIDGFIARHFDQRSESGAYLDPIADKILLVSTFVVLGFLRELPLWLVIATVARDALIMGAVILSTVMANPVAMRPLFISKVNTTVQIILVLVVLAELAFRMDGGPLRQALIYLAAILTAASAAAYLVAWLGHMSGYGESKDNDG